jgi:hypothetical protein
VSTQPTVPGGGPPYPPIDFDYGKAQEVIRQIDALVPVLKQQQLDRNANGHSLRQNWKGHYAVEFDGELRRMWVGSGDLVAKAQALRAKITGAMAAARQQQAWRDEQNFLAALKDVAGAVGHVW